MSGFLKDDLTVALDEVDRIASRIVTICGDLAAIAAQPELAVRLREHGERRRAALAAFNQARRHAGDVPEVGDPERAHVQSLWVALRGAVSGEDPQAHLEQSLRELDEQLREAAQAARRLQPEPAVMAALGTLQQTLEHAS